MRRPSTLAGVVFAALSLAALGSGCGSRGPLDDSPYPSGSASGSADGGDGAAANDATGGGGPGTPGIDASPEPGEGDAGRDAGRPSLGSAVACGSCVLKSCAQGIIQCVQSTSCRTIFQCAASKCLQGGSPDPICLLGCAGSDPGAALSVLSIVTCVTGTCGSDCGSIIGGLGNLGGLGGGGRRPGGKEFEQIFTPWPELLTPVEP